MFNLEQFTRRDILKAVDYIKKENIQLIKSIRYDVLINDESYPPKEIINYTNYIVNGEKLDSIYSYEDILTLLEKLDFLVIIKNRVWKLGTRWGRGAVSYHEMIEKHSLVIGTSDKLYDIGDLILITDGFTVMSLAEIKAKPVKVTDNNNLKDEFSEYEIPYEDWIFTYNVDYISLKKNEVFYYELQAGIREVKNKNIINTAVNIWENRDLNYKNIIFYSKIYQKAPEKEWSYPCFVFEKRNWNDFGNFLSYELYFYNDRNNRDSIGPIKILQKKATNTELEDSFEKLDGNSCSLGQTISFYKRLIEKFPETYADILFLLNDIAHNKELAKNFINEYNFKSLIRTSEAELIYYNFNQAISNTNPSKIEFDYEILLKGALESHKAKILFDVEGVLKNRFFCIVGRNATGKTKFLSSLANKLANESEEGDFIPSRPYFSKIITSTFSYFDKFRIPESKDTNYSFIGIRENGMLLKEDKFSDYIWSSYRKLISDYEKKEFYFECLKQLLEFENLNFNIEELNVFSKKEFLQKTDDIFSSGQNIIFQFITRFIECIEFNSLLIFDEPETHLHPNIIAKLIRTIHSILQKFNSFCIFSTHSPIVLQEMKSKDIVVFERLGNYPLMYKPAIECFGENLTVISNMIFKVDEERELYKNELDHLAQTMSYEEVLNFFKNKLSLNARLYLKTKY